MNVNFFSSKSTTLLATLAAVTLALCSESVHAADPMDQARALIQPTVRVSAQSQDTSAAIDPQLQAVRLILAKPAPVLTAPLQHAHDSQAAGADPHQQARDHIQPQRYVSHPSAEDSHKHLVQE